MKNDRNKARLATAKELLKVAKAESSKCKAQVKADKEAAKPFLAQLKQSEKVAAKAAAAVEKAKAKVDALKPAKQAE